MKAFFIYLSIFIFCNSISGDNLKERYYFDDPVDQQRFVNLLEDTVICLLKNFQIESTSFSDRIDYTGAGDIGYASFYPSELLDDMSNDISDDDFFDSENKLMLLWEKNY